MNQGVRPNKLWHWAAIAFLTATFLAEPRAAFALTWDLFRFAGAIGGELITGSTGGNPDLLDLEGDPPFQDNSVAGDDDGPNDDVTPQPQPDSGPVPEAAPEPEGASAPHGCGPGDSCVYGVPLPDPDTAIAEAGRLHEMTNGALGCLVDDPSMRCIRDATGQWTQTTDSEVST